MSAAVIELKDTSGGHSGHPKFETWLTRLGKQTDILFSDFSSWRDYKTLLTLDSLTITASCAIKEDGTIWLGDSKAIVHVFSSGGRYEELTSFRLDPDDDTPTAVKSLVYSKAIDSLVIASTNGRLWLCDRLSQRLREIGNNGSQFMSVTCVDTGLEGECELWCGQTEGRICVISIKGRGIVASQEVLDHYYEGTTPHLERLDVFNIISEFPSVWTYLYPVRLNRDPFSPCTLT